MSKSRHVFRLRGHYPLWRRFPATSAIKTIGNSSRTSTKLIPYNPAFRRKRFGLFPFRSPLLGVSRELRSIRTSICANGTQLILLSFPLGTEMFHFPRFALMDVTPQVTACAAGFPHSDISGSQATYRLPGAFRRLVASFIAILGQGIHRVLFMSPVRRPENHNHCLQLTLFRRACARRISSYLSHVFGCQGTRASFETNEPPQGAVRSYELAGLAAVPFSLGFVRSRHVGASIREGRNTVNPFCSRVRKTAPGGGFSSRNKDIIP